MTSQDKGVHSLEILSKHISFLWEKQFHTFAQTLLKTQWRALLPVPVGSQEEIEEEARTEPQEQGTKSSNRETGIVNMRDKGRMHL